MLAMSRAFGDRILKQFVVAEPEIQQYLYLKIISQTEVMNGKELKVQEELLRGQVLGG